MAPGAAVDRYRPACCAAVENFVHARHRDAHKQKITRARSLINNDWSSREETKLLASRRNAKNDQQIDDRYANIERENMRLLIRMQEINEKRDRDCERRRKAQPRGEACEAAARIVLGAPPAVGPTRNISRSNSLPAKGRGSNESARMRELRRIDTENQRMLKRLQSARPIVSNKKHEAEHQEQQRVMRMRQEQGPKMPRSKVPLPFTDLGLLPAYDEEEQDTDRIADMHAEMKRRLEELDQMDGTANNEDSASAPASPRSARTSASANDAETGNPDELGDRHEASPKREYVGGQMPEHSRLMVEKLMEELEEMERPKVPAQDQDTPPLEEEDDDPDAVARMLAAADALDAQELEPAAGMAAPGYLSYESVVQRSRAALEARQRGS